MDGAVVPMKQGWSPFRTDTPGSREAAGRLCQVQVWVWLLLSVCARQLSASFAIE